MLARREFIAEVSKTEENFLETTAYKGERFKTESVLDVRTRRNILVHQESEYTHFSTCHPSGVKGGAVKGEALVTQN